MSMKKSLKRYYLYPDDKNNGYFLIPENLKEDFITLKGVISHKNLIDKFEDQYVYGPAADLSFVNPIHDGIVPKTEQIVFKVDLGTSCIYLKSIFSNYAEYLVDNDATVNGHAVTSENISVFSKDPHFVEVMDYAGMFDPKPKVEIPVKSKKDGESTEIEESDKSTSSEEISTESI